MCCVDELYRTISFGVGEPGIGSVILNWTDSLGSYKLGSTKSEENQLCPKDKEEHLQKSLRIK